MRSPGIGAALSGCAGFSERVEEVELIGAMLEV
jgi:hypothetical protein